MNRKNPLIWACMLIMLALALGSCGNEPQIPSEPMLETTQPVLAAETEPTTQATTEPETAPAVEATTLPATEPTETDESAVEFVAYPEVVNRGETATVTIQGQPDTEYAITVYYKSGPSTASGLESQTSDGEGYVSWSWRIGSRTSPGTFKIEVSGGGERKTVNFSIAEG